MLINKQIKNTLYTIKRKSQGFMPNMLYSLHGSFFDMVMNSLPEIAPPILPLNNKSIIDYSYYNGIWLNDLVDFSQKIPYYANFFTNILIAIHDAPGSFFKKEDLSILQNNMDRYHFLAFTDKFNQWSLSNVKYIKYGVMKPTHDITQKTKDILIINSKQQKQTHILFQYINKEYPKSDIIQNIPKSINEIQNIISKYKICIDFDYYYNLIVANSCGSYGITSLQSCDNSIYTAHNSGQIMTFIKILLENKSKTYQDISSDILIKYDWNTFIENICEYVKNKYYQEFTI